MLSATKVVDDEPVQDGAQVVAKTAFIAVGPGEFVGEQLGPELLKDLIGEIAVAEFQAQIALDGVVVSADQFAHRRLAFGAGEVGGTDRRPVRLECGEAFLGRWSAVEIFRRQHGTTKPWLGSQSRSPEECGDRVGEHLETRNRSPLFHVEPARGRFRGCAQVTYHSRRRTLSRVRPRTLANCTNLGLQAQYTRPVKRATRLVPWVILGVSSAIIVLT
jgi:hypothetical protein